ncbi:MAG: PilZ domain-containing protein [Deltaproteobacteria bacterium]|nr:PilZ domain-containing protein [Deltaproteobacteria bacterium]MBW2395075.1 PilZ domain-containing protein [Deltaproteobacteria bacterium]
MTSAEPRRDFSVPIRVDVRRANGTESREFATNLSPRGLCIHTQEVLAIGENVQLRFELPPSGPQIETRGSVIWTDRRDEGEARFWETGLRLDVDDSTWAKLQEWASQPTDRRR